MRNVSVMSYVFWSSLLSSTNVLNNWKWEWMPLMTITWKNMNISDLVQKLRWKHKFVYQCHSHSFGLIWFNCTLSLKCIKLNSSSRMKMCHCKIDPPDIKHKHSYYDFTKNHPVWISVLCFCFLLSPWARVFATHESKKWQYYIDSATQN